jgi:hypothetical protein
MIIIALSQSFRGQARPFIDGNEIEQPEIYYWLPECRWDKLPRMADLNGFALIFSELKAVPCPQLSIIIW